MFGVGFGPDADFAGLREGFVFDFQVNFAVRRLTIMLLGMMLRKHVFRESFNDSHEIRPAAIFVDK
jgi:hypothetical protein